MGSPEQPTTPKSIEEDQAQLEGFLEPIARTIKRLSGNDNPLERYASESVIKSDLTASLPHSAADESLLRRIAQVMTSVDIDIPLTHRVRTTPDMDKRVNTELLTRINMSIADLRKKMLAQPLDLTLSNPEDPVHQFEANLRGSRLSVRYIPAFDLCAPGPGVADYLAITHHYPNYVVGLKFIDWVNLSIQFGIEIPERHLQNGPPYLYWLEPNSSGSASMEKMRQFEGDLIEYILGRTHEALE